MFVLTIQYSGVDFDDDAQLAVLSESAPHISWSVDSGLVSATAYLEARSIVEAAEQMVEQIARAVPGAQPIRMDEDLVNTFDVADRCGVNRETVRLWAAGLRGPGGFPSPRGRIGRDAQQVWDWGSVQSWLQEQYRLGGVAIAPGWAEVAKVNMRLQQLRLGFKKPGLVYSSSAVFFRRKVNPGWTRTSQGFGVFAEANSFGAA
jgi:hypothetical protein